MKYVTLSITTRDRDNDRGGVPLVNFYIQKALGTECGSYRTSEIPILRAEGIIDENTICIVDGNNGLSLPPSIKVVSIVHGSWKEFCVRNDKLKDFALEIEMQDAMWVRRPNTRLVASSSSLSLAH